MYNFDLIPDVEGCVYKLWYADKYVIVKCKTLWRSRENITINLSYFLRNTPRSRREDNLLYNFFMHVVDNPQQDFQVEVLLSSNNPYQLLKSEFIELTKGKEDPRCLNNYFEPYIPQRTNKKGESSWINKGYYLNYMNWRRKFRNNSDIR